MKSALHPAPLLMILLFPPALFAGVGDAVVTTWFQGAEAAYTLTYDDNEPDQFNYIGPALAERGLKATFFVNPDYDGMRSWQWYHDDYANLASQGHELGSHTLTHESVIPNDPLWPDNCMKSFEELEEDCIEAKAILEALVPDTTTVSFCYPMGREDEASREIIAEHFLSARDVHTYTNYPTGHYTPNPASPPDMYSLGCFVSAGSGGNGTPNFRSYEESVEAFAAYITDTLAVGGWAIEYRHNLWGTSEAAYWEHLDDLQMLAEDGTIWNGTQGQVTKYIYSRDAAQIEPIDVQSDLITLSVDDFLDDAVFDIPVTLSVEIPGNWAEAECTILHGSTSVIGRIFSEEETAFISFDIVADGRPITISPGLPTVPEPATGLLIGSLLLGLGTFRRRRFTNR